MTAAQLFGEGIYLMLSGMGFVLVFLLMLVWVIRLMSKLINRYFPEHRIPTKTAPNATSLKTDDEFEHLRPVIVAAIAHHRRNQGLN